MRQKVNYLLNKLFIIIKKIYIELLLENDPMNLMIKSREKESINH